jgi:hypothetical protein
MFVIFCISSHHTQGTFVFVVCSIQFQGNGRWVLFLSSEILGKIKAKKNIERACQNMAVN